MPRDTTVEEFLIDTHFCGETTQPSEVFLCFKRSLDIFTSLIILPIVIAVCVIALILNPFLNPGKLFFTQERVGKNGIIFRIYKLRTMQGRCDDAKFATEECSRITPLGKFMRDIHIDELPQIINVLIGNMSLIGPRPEQLKFFRNYAQNIQSYSLRQTVRPGISGMAQIRCGYTDCDVGARLKLKWDLEYVRNQRFGLEGQIYLQTFTYVFPRVGKRLFGLLNRYRSG